MSWKDYLYDNNTTSSNNTTSKIKWKDFLEENDNFKKYKADRALQSEESAKSLYSNQMDYTSPYYVAPKQAELTPPPISKPKEDNGFWEKVRNLNLEDTKLFKTLTSPIDALYKIPLTQRILTTAGNTIGGEGAVQNPDGTPMEKLNAGKVGNVVSDLVGTGLGYSMPMAGLNNSLQGATSKIMQPVENLIPKGTSKLAQYGNNALRQGLEFGALNAAQATAENKDIKDIGLSALEGLGQGAAFGTLTKGAGELIPKIKNSAFSDWKTTFETNGMLNNPKGMNFNQTIPIKTTIMDTINKTVPKTETINQEIPKVSTYKARLSNEIKPETLPLENRDIKNVGNKTIKSYQYEHPEIKPYYQEEANILKGELERTKSGNDVTYKRDDKGYLMGVERSARITSQSIAEIKDATKASYEEIGKALDAIIKDHGSENNALSKKIELILDDRLSNGYSDMYTGQDIPSNTDYIYTKSLIGKKYENIPIFKGYEEKPLTVTRNQTIQEQAPREVIQNVRKPINPLSEPQKVQGNIITPNEVPMPMQSDKGVVDNKGFNLQLFDRSAEQPKKTSEFYTNSLKETQILPEDVKKLLDESDFTYGVKTNKAELLKAETRIKTRGLDFEMNRLKQSKSYDNAEDTMAHLLITKNLKDEAQKTGDYSKVVDWLKETRAKTTNTAQALQAVSAWKKTTPEGALIKAQSVVDDVQKDIKTHNPKLNNKIDNEVNTVKGAIEEAKKQAAKEIAQKLPEKMLANRVSSTIKDPKETKPSVINDMVNELFKVAKESPLPEKITKAKRSPLEYLQSAIENKSQYGDVWEKAKAIVKDKYADDPQASQILDDYFNKGIIPNYSNATVGNSVKISIKDLGTTLDNIARTSKSNKEQFLNDLTEHIAKTTGASGEDAATLASKIKEQYDNLVKEKSASIVKQMFKEVPKAQKKTIEQKISELVNLGAFDDSQLRDLVSQKYGVPTLTAEDAKYITETMTKAQSMAEGYDKNAEIAKVMQLIADKIPATASEKLQAYLRISMLTNIKTLLVRNPLGNVGLNIAENIKDIPASLIDKAVSLKTGQRTTIAPSLKGLAEQGKGLAQGVKEWNMDRKLNIDTSPSRGQYELPSKRIFHNNVLNAVDQFTRRSLGLGDRPFYQAAYNDRLRQLKVINKTSEITEAMKEDAVNYALERTLQNKSSLSKGAGMIKKGLNLNKDFGLGSIAMPFTTTPANVLDKALDYSPIGALKATAEWGKFLKTGEINQKKLVDELGRSITGTAAIVLGWELAKNGLATGKSSTNARERELNKATGVNDYAFKVGDKYKTFDWAQPMSLPLAMGIDMYNAKKTKGDIKNALTSAGDIVFKQSFLQGISRMFGGYSPSEGVLNTVTNSYTMAVPTTLRQVQQLSDPLQRETYSDNAKQQSLNTIKSKVPFLSKTLEPKIDVLGNKTKQFDGKNNLFNVLINPGYSNTDKNTDGTNMVRQVVEATNNKDILPKVPDNKITYVSEIKNKGTKNREEVKETINLTPKELTSLKQYIGQETLNLYNDKAKDSTFMDKTPKDKAKELESLLRKIYDKGEENILKSRNITFY